MITDQLQTQSYTSAIQADHVWNGEEVADHSDLSCHQGHDGAGRSYTGTRCFEGVLGCLFAGRFIPHTVHAGAGTPPRGQGGQGPALPWLHPYEFWLLGNADWYLFLLQGKPLLFHEVQLVVDCGNTDAPIPSILHFSCATFESGKAEKQYVDHL